MASIALNSIVVIGIKTLSSTVQTIPPPTARVLLLGYIQSLKKCFSKQQKMIHKSEKKVLFERLSINIIGNKKIADS